LPSLKEGCNGDLDRDESAEGRKGDDYVKRKKKNGNEMKRWKKKPGTAALVLAVLPTV
jgi:hypothetical protein